MKTITNPFKIIFTLAILFISNALMAQNDLIIKKDSTQIRCTILKTDVETIKYTFLVSEKKLEKATISKALVDRIYYNKFDVNSTTPILPEVKKETKKENKKDETETPKDSVKSYTYTFGLGLNFENILEFNTPNKADKKIFSATAAIDLGLDYAKEGKRFAMTNELHWIASVRKAGLTGDNNIERTTDDLKLLHDFSYQLSRNSKWNFNLIAKSTTSIFTIYDGDTFKDYNNNGKTQAFLSPYEMILSPGIKYQPNASFRVSISPYSVSLYGLMNQEIANTGLYTQTVDENNNYDLYLFTKLGAELNIWYDKKVKKWLDMKYRLGVSSDYLSQDKVTGLMEGLFITKIRIFKNFSITHRGVLKGDLFAQPLKPNYKQNILFSYSVKF
jgi:hypothetical protein